MSKRKAHEAVVMEMDDSGGAWKDGAFEGLCLESGEWYQASLGDLSPRERGIDRCVAKLDTNCPGARHVHATRAVASRKGAR